MLLVSLLLLVFAGICVVLEGHMLTYILAVCCITFFVVELFEHAIKRQHLLRPEDKRKSKDDYQNILAFEMRVGTKALFEEFDEDVIQHVLSDMSVEELASVARAIPRRMNDVFFEDCDATTDALERKFQQNYRRLQALINIEICHRC